MSKNFLTLALLLYFNSVVMAQVSESEYKANFDKCWKRLLSQECDRSLLTEADLLKIENKYSPTQTGKSKKGVVSAPYSRSTFKVLSKNTNTLYPDSTVNQSTKHTVRRFRRNEVPSNYSGDYIIIDDGNSSLTTKKSSQYKASEDIVTQNRNQASGVYQPGYSDYGSKSQQPIPSSNQHRVKANSTAYDSNPTVPGNQTATDSAILGALGVAVVIVFIFLAGWLLKLLFRGGQKAAQVTAKGVSLGKEKMQGVRWSEESKILAVDDDYYEQAFDEIAANKPERGLWIKAQTIAEGDEKKHRATYIRLRAKALQQESEKTK